MSNDGRPDILIVDDEPANLLALEATLGDLDVNLVRAGSGEEALRQVLAHDFAAILLDVRMPTLSGFEAARLIRSRPRSAHTPIIFLTAGDGTAFDVREAYRLGAVDYLTKPLVPEVLRAKAAFFVELFRKTEQLRELERRRADAAVRESERRLELAVAIAQMGTFEIDLVTDAVTVNEPGRAIYGWDRPHTTFTQVQAHFHPDDKDEVLRRVGAAFDPAGPGVFEVEHRIYRTGGAVRWIRVRGQAFFEGEGAARRAVRCLGAYLDVTDRKRAEQAIRDREEWLRTITDSLPVLVGYIDRDHRYGFANRGYTDWFGLAPADVVGKPARDVLGADVYEQRRPYLDAALRGKGQRFRGPTRHRRNGLLQTEVTYTPHVVGGEVRGLFVLVQDVTEQRRSEEALRRSEGRARAIIEGSVIGFAHVDLTGRFLEVNARQCEILGRPAGELLGVRMQDVTHPDDLPANLALFGRLVADGTPFEIEKRYVRPDGSARWVINSVAALRDPAGRPESIVAIVQDITERKRAENRLRLLYAVGEATREAADPRAVMVATAGLLGGHLAATRCAYADVEPDNDRFTIRDDWTAPGAVSTAGVYSLDLFGPRAAADMRAGRTLIVRDVDRELAPHEGAEMFNAIGIKAIVCCPLVKVGRLVAMMAVHQDRPRDWTADDVALVEEIVERSWAHIERVRAAEALREADRRKDEFLATLAHELRNPLAPIRNGLQLLKLAPAGGNTAARALGMMERQLGHMVRLIDDLLDISRVSRGKVELRRERVTLQAVIDAAVETSRPVIDAGRHELTTSVPEDPVWLDADPTRVAQVVGNVLTNAAKYTPDGGRIELVARREGSNAVVSVTDTGVGIPRELLGGVFDMFAQVNKTLDRAQGGLGIGLAIVKRLVEMHGGTITADSPGPGRGSTFTVRLPAAGGPAASPPPANGDAAPANPGGRRILVVDDNQDAADSLAMVLELSGHRTRTAHDGPVALAAARAFRPEVVFLDIGLPGMSGHEVARWFRQDPDLCRAVLVALTGWGSEDDKRKSEEAGFDAHLTKPVEVSALTDVLARLSPPGRGGAATAAGEV